MISLRGPPKLYALKSAKEEVSHPSQFSKPRKPHYSLPRLGLELPSLRLQHLGLLLARPVLDGEEGDTGFWDDGARVSVLSAELDYPGTRMEESRGRSVAY